MFQVVADGLPTEFPVLRKVDDFAGNLPQLLSSLVGREQLVTDVGELVRSDRLVTVCGVGGVGRLGCLSRSAPSWRVSSRTACGSSSSPPSGTAAPIPAAIATVMGITPQGDVPLLDTVAEALAGRRMLLLLDNCEHVLGDATSAVEAMLGRAGNLKIVATSREPLGLSGEVGRDREPAHRGRRDRRPTPSPCSSIGPCRPTQLRGSRTRPTPTAVTEICEAVDGLPLGIELAAARMAAMSAVEVQGSSGGPLSPASGHDARTRAPAHLASRRRVVLRPAERERAGVAPDDLGVRRRVRSRQHRSRGRER